MTFYQYWCELKAKSLPADTIMACLDAWRKNKNENSES